MRSTSRSRLLVLLACSHLACGRLGFEPRTDTFLALLSTSETSPTNSAPLTLQADFSVDVVDFAATAISTSSGRLGEMRAISPRSYQIDLMPEGSALVSVWMMEGVVHDAAGHHNQEAAPLEIYYDVDAPVVTSVSINQGAEFAPSPLVAVRASVSDLTADFGLWVRLTEAAANGDCQAQYADQGWQTYGGASQDYSFLVSSGDSVKKVCVWAKDTLGNVSVISPSSCTQGLDCDTIRRETDNIPEIVAFDVANGNSASPNYHTRTLATGDAVEVSWSVRDVEGLANNPIELEYTTDDETWNPILSGYGGLTGNPTTYSDVYAGFLAPVDTFLRLRLVARDAAGNTSVRALSDFLNSGAWSVYAGNDDDGVGVMGRSARLAAYYLYGARFAIHPFTNDIYAACEGLGTLKLAALSGEVSLFASHSGTNNLPDSGPLPEEPAYYVYYTYPQFDHRGRLYLVTYQSGDDVVAHSGAVYQIDLELGTVRRYIGGGTDYGTSASPFEMVVIPSPIVFDEADSLYFVSSCTPDASEHDNPTYRLMKVTQNADGTAGVFSVVAGDCTDGTPIPGALAVESPFPGSSYKGRFAEIAVWNHGEVVYVADSPMWKILNGRVYAVDAAIEDCDTLAYEPVSDRILVGNRSLAAYVPGLTGDGGEVLDRVIVRNDGNGNCTADGIDSQEACVHVGGVRVTGQGVPVFADGPSNDRLRYVDPAGKVQTLLGTLPLYGAGLNMRFLRGGIGGIYFKQPTEPNTGAFPPGLYFASPDSVVLGYLDPSTGLSSILWGNQQGEPSSLFYETGTAIGPDQSLGSASDQGNVTALGFEEGLPFLRYNHRLVKVDAAGLVVALQRGATSWDTFSGADPADSYMRMYGTRHNMTIKDGGVFLIGGGSWPEAGDPGLGAVIRFFDFPGRAVIDIMGDNTIPPGFSPDSPTPGSVQGLTLDRSCIHWEQSGHNVYRGDESPPRLYFSEGDKIRYIEDPTNPSQSTLGTLFTGAAGFIQDFSFSPSGDKVFYLVHYAGYLYCYRLFGTDLWCDNATELGMPGEHGLFWRGPNHFTWMGERTLLISNHGSTILELDLDKL